MPQEKRDNFFTELLKFALIAIVIVIPIRLFVAKPFIVSGASMEPTFDNGQYLIIDELSYRFDTPKRGDVVIFRYPKDPSQYFIKRIIGLPRETVHIKSGAVSVTTALGEVINLDENYIVHHGNGGDLNVSLANDRYFVMGDNRPESSDSRIWGVLPRENMVGRALLRLLPIETVELFPGKIEIQ
ncbi:MAG: signal peptidase I [Parcubacteria group bacterium Gr01-1014_56]|nr:MAG: signal peptidase I [Parcubacteria group bacterium Gr01-1014_56]